MRSVVVALSGPSGSGKTSVSEHLVRTLGWSWLDEAYYRLRPRPSLKILAQDRLRALELRLLDEEARRFAEARELAGRGRTVVLDTGFLDPVVYTAGLYALRLATPATWRAVRRHALALARRRRLGVADLTVRLAVPVPTRRRRAADDPRGHPRAFRQRHENVGEIEGALLTPRLEQALPGRFRRLRAVAPVATVAERIRRAARRTTPLRDPYRAAARAIQALERLPEPGASRHASGNLKRRTLPPPRSR